MNDLVKVRKAWRLLGTVFTHNRKQWYYMKLWNVPRKNANKAKKIAKEEGFEASIVPGNATLYDRRDRCNCIIRVS